MQTSTEPITKGRIKVTLAHGMSILAPRERRIITNEIYEISKKKWKYIPIEEIRKAFAKANYILLQEDNTPYQGMFLGEKGEARISFGKADPDLIHDLLDGSAHRAVYDTFFEPIKNNLLILQWYKDVGMTAFEINAYIS
jgi:hypothetical protein